MPAQLAGLLQVIGDLSSIGLLIVFAWLLISGRLLSRDAVDRIVAVKDEQLAAKDVALAHERAKREECEHDRMRNGSGLTRHD